MKSWSYKEILAEERVALVPPTNKVKKLKIKRKRSKSKYVGFDKHIPLFDERTDAADPAWGPLITPEQDVAIQKMYQQPPNPRREAWIQTYTGKKFYPLAPAMADICIQDIAHSLSMLCRFTGHTQRFYSVAEHCVLVSYLCSQADSFHGLLHDAAEYALQDFPAPLKRSGQFDNYKKYEKTLQSLIYRKFGLATEEPPSVKKADLQLLATESRDLMSPLHPEWHTQYKPLPFAIRGLPPAEAEQLFLDRFDELNAQPAI
jgi:uncharacterized protein